MLCEQSIVRNNSGLKFVMQFQTAVFGWNELLAYHGMDGETSERETIMKYFRKYVLSILLCFILTGCGQQAGFSESVSAVPVSNFTESQTGVPETVMQQQTDADAEKAEIKSASDNVRPSKEEVLAMREKTLDGMPETEISRLRENIKVANLQMESAYLNDNLFKKLSDKESPYWQYFDCKGDIQLGWWYHQAIYPKDVIMKAENITEEEFAETYTEPGIVTNSFDAAAFIDLISEMKSFVKNEALAADLQQLMDLTRMAWATHEMQYANELYKVLHDLDYFLLRYGIEDVGQYTADAGTVGTYYGVLAVYGAEPFSAEEQTKAFGKILWDAYCFGKIEGTDHGVPDTYGQESTYFALYDVDGDGQEELLLNWTGASMADTVEYIWGYGDNGTHVELCEFPALTCYDNGVIEAEWSHNQGPAGEFWPYFLYRYNAETDQYEICGGADAWDKSVAKTQEQGEVYPDDIDADQDGVVYYLLPADWDGNYDMEPVDGAKYRTWRESFLEGASKLDDIWFWDLKEENIAILGAEKPNYKREIKIEK